jgi:hypothetical protein
METGFEGDFEGSSAPPGTQLKKTTGRNDAALLWLLLRLH